MTLLPPPPRRAVPYAAGAGRPTHARNIAGHQPESGNPQPAATGTIGRSDHHPGRAPVCRSNGRAHWTRRNRIDALVCGLDNVVIGFDPAVPRDIETRYGLSDGALLDTLLEWPTAQLASIGAIDHTTWLRYAAQTLPAQAVDEWLAHHGRLNQPLVELLEAAKGAGLRLLFLSNSTKRLYDDLAHHQITDLAEHVYASVEVGYAKPDPRTYQYLFHHAALVPAHTMYVDNLPTWVRAGRDLGMRAVQYTDVDRLRAALARAGVAL